MVTDGLHKVTGELTPDSTGDYLPDVMFSGKMSYRRTDGAYFIWWNDPVSWILSPLKEIPVGEYWGHAEPDVEGIYNPAGGADGIATVTEI